MANYDASIRVSTIIDTKDVERADKEVERLAKKLDGVRARSAKLEALGGTEKQFEALGYDAEMLEKQLEAATLKAEELRTAFNMQNSSKEFSKATQSAKNLFNTIDKGTKKSNTGLSNTTRMLGRMMIQMMAFRAAMATIEYVKSGIDNLVQHSTKLNGVFSDLKSSSTQLKNSLATAFSPILTMIIPYITQLIGWLNTAMNYIAQFLAVLGGKNTYTRAKKQVVDYAKSLGTATKAAKGALAAFDEINVLDRNEGSSGNAGGEATGADAFEEVEVDKSKFGWVDWLRENLDTILTIIEAIGIGLLGWKIASALGYGLKEAIGLGIAASGAFLLGKYALDAWTNGVDWENFTGMLAGAAILIAGLGLAFGATGVAIGAAVSGLIMIWTALGDIMDRGVNLQNALLLLLGTFLTFTAIGGAAIGALAAVAAGFFLAIIADWDNFKKTFIEPLKLWWSNLQKNFSQGINGVKKILEGLNLFINGVFAGNWAQAWEGIKMIFSGAWDAIVGIAKFAINTVIGFINAIVNAMSGAVNAVINAINSINFTVPDWVPVLGGKTFGGFGIPNIPNPANIPYLATGGIVTSSTLANIGEAGREAVLPLDNNTEWMDALADRINSGREIRIVFTGSLSELGRVLKPVIDAENVRIGNTYQLT